MQTCCNLTTSHSIMNSLLVAFPPFLPCTLILWQQLVSDSTFLFPGSLITMTNRMWVILSFLLSCHVNLWPTGCVWYFPFILPCNQSHLIIPWQYVSDNTPFFLPFNLITSCCMINSKWVTMYFLCHGASCLLPWHQHVSDHTAFCPSLFFAILHHISLHNQQYVSHCFLGESKNLFLFPVLTNRKWHWSFSVR